MVRLALFLSIFFLFTLSPVTTSSDSRWTVPTMVSFLRNGTLNIDDYKTYASPRAGYTILQVNGHAYSAFPLLPAFFALPAVVIFDASPAILPGVGKTKSDHWERASRLRAELERLSASFFIAIAALFLFEIAHATLSTTQAVIFTALFACGTPLWSVASRALWSQTPAFFFSAIALFFLTKKSTCTRDAALGVCCALAYAMRPTCAVLVAAAGIYLLICERRALIGYVAGAVPILAFFLAFNHAIYGTVLPSYFAPQRLEASSGFLTAIAGELVSPARGLLIFSPFFAAAVIAIFFQWKRAGLNRLQWLCIAICTAHLAVIAAFPKWWGGQTYGPRFWIEVLPFLFFLSIPLWELVQASFRTKSSAPRACLIVLLFLVACAIHSRGAWSYRVYQWNIIPVSVDEAPARLWDWSDPQFLR